VRTVSAVLAPVRALSYDRVRTAAVVAMRSLL
jgi:hypothetical protein